MATTSSPRLDTSVLTFHDALQPRFWLPDQMLRPVVRERLVKIAAAYQDHLALPKGVKVRDITFTGSLTGRNYTRYSDVDIHLLVDYEAVGDEALVSDYFDLKRKAWSETYPVSVYGFPVEVYVQSYKQYHQDPAGHYSLRSNKWVRPAPEPGQDQEAKDEKALVLARQYVQQARGILAKSGKPGQLGSIKSFIQRFKSMRQRGISGKAGIYSAENLAFKILRNSGSLDKLWDIEARLESQALTLKEQLTHLPMKTPVFNLTESQVKMVKRALLAEQQFLRECTQMGNLLTEEDLLNEGLLDSLGEKIKNVFNSGGAPLLRKTLLAAVLAGKLLIPVDAIARAASEAGLDRVQTTELVSDINDAREKTGTSGEAHFQDFAAALRELNQRYVIDNNDPQHQKQFMHFTGELKDVVDIGKNGFPIFAPGSVSQQTMDAAFASPQPLTGVVSVPVGGQLKEFAGKFVEANGLFYTFAQSKPPVADSTSNGGRSATPTPAPTSARASVEDKGHMFDFSGIVFQARERYNFKKRSDGTVNDNLYGGPKAYTNLADYTADFIRRSGFGLESYSNAQFAQLFSNGLKVRVPKLPGGGGARS